MSIYDHIRDHAGSDFVIPPHLNGKSRNLYFEGRVCPALVCNGWALFMHRRRSFLSGSGFQGLWMVFCDGGVVVYRGNDFAIAWDLFTNLVQRCQTAEDRVCEKLYFDYGMPPTNWDAFKPPAALTARLVPVHKINNTLPLGFQEIEMEDPVTSDVEGDIPSLPWGFRALEMEDPE